MSYPHGLEYYTQQAGAESGHQQQTRHKMSIANLLGSCPQPNPPASLPHSQCQSPGFFPQAGLPIAGAGFLVGRPDLQHTTSEAGIAPSGPSTRSPYMGYMGPASPATPNAHFQSPSHARNSSARASTATGPSPGEASRRSASSRFPRSQRGRRNLPNPANGDVVDVQMHLYELSWPTPPKDPFTACPICKARYPISSSTWKRDVRIHKDSHTSRKEESKHFVNLERWYNNASSITSDGGGGWARCLVPGCEHWGDRDTPYLDTELTAAFRCHRDKSLHMRNVAAAGLPIDNP